MRQTQSPQLQFGQVEISQIKISTKSRDDVPKLLLGIQQIYQDGKLREGLFSILSQMQPKINPTKRGRPGMDLWKVFVLGMCRANLNWDYDRLQEMANQHRTLRQMLGHGLADEDYEYPLQTLKDNLKLLTPEILDQINQLIVNAGHQLLKKKAKI